MHSRTAFRQRLQQRARYAAAVRANRDTGQDGRLFTVIISVAIAIVAAWCFLGDLKSDPVISPMQQRIGDLLSEANNAVTKVHNYTMALEHLRKAERLAPSDDDVLSLLARVLLGHGRVEEAHKYLHNLSNSRGEVAKRSSVLQHYVLSFHRLGKIDELNQIWPDMVAKPGVKWRTPWQCPDEVDEALLEESVPFPAPEHLRVPRILKKNAGIIMKEFEAFRRDPEWSSERYFRPNRDNDFVQGNINWTEMPLYSGGSWEHRACAILPSVCRALRGLLDIEGIVHSKPSGQVRLLKLEEGTALVPHFGSVNWRYTAHLGLLVPNGVTMTAGRESKSFVQGKVLVLDDSFLHSVEHTGVGPQVTLFANFFHPRTRPITYDQWLMRGHST